MLPPSECYALIQNSLVGKLFGEFRYPGLMTNAEHRIVWANRAFEGFYGYKVEEVIGLPASMLHDPSLPDDTLKPVARQLLERRKPWTGTYRNRRANGEIITAYYFAAPLDHFAHLPVNGVFCVSCPESEADGLRDEVLAYLVNRCLSLAAAAEAEGNLPITTQFSRKGQRRREIHRLTLLGYSSKEIAGLMGISPSTVNVVRWKLGCASKRNGRARKKLPSAQDK